MMSDIRKSVSALQLIAAALVCATLTTPVAAESFRCTNQETGRTYVSSQRVPGDRCAPFLESMVTSIGPTKDELPPRIKAELSAAIREAEADRVDVIRKSRAPDPSIGMTADMARASSWGKPQTVRRTTTPAGVTEYWFYSGNRMLSFRNNQLNAISE